LLLVTHLQGVAMMTWMPEVYYGWRDRFSKRRVVNVI